MLQRGDEFAEFYNKGHKKVIQDIFQTLGENIRKVGYSRGGTISAIGLRCYQTAFLVSGLVETMALLVDSMRTYEIVTYYPC